MKKRFIGNFILVIALLCNTTLLLAGSGKIEVSTITCEGTSVYIDKNLNLNNNSVSSVNSLTATSLTGTLQTAAQTNVTSVGTLTSLDIDNINLNSNIIKAKTSSGLYLQDDGANNAIFVEDGGYVGIGTTNPSVPLHVNGNLTATNIAGTLTTAAQTNITSVGTTLRVADMYLYGNTLAAFDNDGLYLLDNAGNQGMFIEDGGYVGIGTSNPGFPLHVVGSPLSWKATETYFYANGTGYAANLNPVSAGNADYSIYAYYGIVTDTIFIVNSDARIKELVKRVDTQDDLKMIKALKPLDYKKKDHVTKGNKIYRGFYAQEVEEVFPGAVQQRTDFIPNVYEVAQKLKYNEKKKTLKVYLKKEHDFKAGDIVKIIAFKDKEYQLPVTKIISKKAFVLKDCEVKPEKVFVYGKQVDDFKVLDYDAVFTVGIGAIQELSKQMEKKDKQIENLQEQINTLKHKIEKE